MPRSSSTAPSESSHDSESPRKRAPATEEDVMMMDIDQSLSALGDPASLAPLNSCEHMQALNGSKQMLAHYEKALNWSSSALANGQHLAKRRRMQTPTCGTCHNALHRPLMCLECRFTGCWSRSHIKAHLTQSKHALAVDLKTGSIYCGICNDFQLFALNGTRLPKDSSLALPASELKRKRQPFKVWLPNTIEKNELQKAGSVPCEARRGFLNLGATCYMSVILQSFLHNPLLRNYFLSDKHNRQLCGKANCMCCELDQLFEDVFSSTSTPPPEAPAGTGPALGPVSLLRTTWENSNDIAGTSQQDAHEFFINLLNQIHLGSTGSTDESSCTCVVHQVFAGKLQSDVKCGKCGHINPTVDPLLDISLELKGILNGKVTLASCLRRYTEQEKLPPKAYVCSKCQSSAIEATKQLSIRKLPPVLCIQLKRFEHKSSASKIDLPVKFPAIINMAPFTTAAIGMEARDGKRPKLDPTVRHDYELFAVINHEGQLNTGHYTNFGRSQNEWYRFDDEKVTHATLKECLNSVPYMCFYVRKNLEYGNIPLPTPMTTPTKKAPASTSKPPSASKPPPTPQLSLSQVSTATTASTTTVPPSSQDIADDASDTSGTDTSER